MKERLDRDYNGPILVTDIDETLRHNEPPPAHILPGVQTIMNKVASKGVPIVFLTAAPRAEMRSINRTFLLSFPTGFLIDRPTQDDSPNASFKTRILRSIQEAYPRASLVCMGDNMTGDAIAYQVCSGGSFIRKVTPWCKKNRPRNWDHHLEYEEYDPATQDHILHRIKQLKRGTQSAHGRVVFIPKVQGGYVGRSTPVSVVSAASGSRRHALRSRRHRY